MKRNWSEEKQKPMAYKLNQQWFFAVVFCRVLVLTNPTQAVKSLDDYEKSTLRLTKGGPQRNIINESGLYHLLTKSTKKRAVKFRHWNFHDVLPTIRKTGSPSVKKQLQVV